MLPSHSNSLKLNKLNVEKVQTAKVQVCSLILICPGILIS